MTRARARVGLKRAEFLNLLGILLAGCTPPLAPVVAPPPAPPPPPPPAAPPEKVRRYKHWAWLTANRAATDDDYKREFQRMAEAGVSFVLCEAFNGSEAFYASKHLPNGGDWLGRVAELAKAAKLEVYAWTWCMPCNIEAVATAHPEWFVVDKNGESLANKPGFTEQGGRYLCPSRPEVREFLKQRVSELVAYPVAGIHLDYLQYPQVILPAQVQARHGLKQETELAAYDYCYCEECRTKFKQTTDIDPLNFNQPAENEAWRKFRYDRLSELVNSDLVPVIRQANKRVSAAVLPDWQSGRQDYSNWQLDAALPLLYHTLYEEDLTWVGFQTQQAVEQLGGKSACYSSLLVGSLSPPDLTGAVRLALESGAGGVALFSGQAMSSQHWEAFRRVVEAAEAEAEQTQGG